MPITRPVRLVASVTRSTITTAIYRGLATPISWWKLHCAADHGNKPSHCSQAGKSHCINGATTAAILLFHYSRITITLISSLY